MTATRFVTVLNGGMSISHRTADGGRSSLGRVKGGEAHVGTDPEGRAASIAEVMAVLARWQGCG